MKEEILVDGLMPIIGNLAKQRFLYHLALAQCVIKKNNGSIDLYEVYDREEKIKIKLAKHKKVKMKDMNEEDYIAVQAKFANFIASEEECEKRYDFLVEIMLLLNMTTLNISDLRKIIENPDNVYEEYFQNKFEQEEIINLKKRAKFLISK